MHLPRISLFDPELFAYEAIATFKVTTPVRFLDAHPLDANRGVDVESEEFNDHRPTVSRNIDPINTEAETLGYVVCMTPKSRQLGDLRWIQIAQLLGPRSIIVQPLGAIEQHGPHLPLNTDQVIADEVSRALIERAGDENDLWLLPTIAYTKSNEHAGFPGSMWMSADTMLRVLDDLARCVALLPTNRLVFLNAHGGNTGLLGVACRDLRLAHGLRTFLAHPGVPPDQGGPSGVSELGMGVHGGLDETSMMLYLRPDLVDMNVATRNVPEVLASNHHVRFGGRVSFGWLASDFGTDGHIGDPTGATAEHGRQILDSSLDQLCAAMQEVRDFEFDR